MDNIRLGEKSKRSDKGGLNMISVTELKQQYNEEEVSAKTSVNSTLETTMEELKDDLIAKAKTGVTTYNFTVDIDTNYDTNAIINFARNYFMSFGYNVTRAQLAAGEKTLYGFTISW